MKWRRFFLRYYLPYTMLAFLLIWGIGSLMPEGTESWFLLICVILGMVSMKAAFLHAQANREHPFL